jgi:imidazolonepropionase-like amidohydrolase
MTDVGRSRWRSSLRSRAKPVRGAVSTVLLCLAGSFFLLTNSPVARLDAPDVFAIKDAQIVTGTGKTIAKGTVVFRKGLITEVGENVKIPADARVIEGAGLTVYPGLIDGYTSLGLASSTQQRAGGGGAAAAAQQQPAAAQQQQPQTNPAHGDPASEAADQVRPGGTPMEDARSAGFTAALTTARQGIFPGQSALINLAGDEPQRIVVRAPVALTVQFTAGGGFGGGYPSSLMGTVAFIRQSFYDATNYRDQLDRYNRTKRGVPRPDHDKKLAALQPALRGDMPVLFVANSEGDIRRALRLAEEFKLKPIIAGGLQSYRVAGLLKARNVPVILSVDFPKRSVDLPDEEDEPIRVLRERDEAPKGAGLLAKAGVKFAFTTGGLRPQDFIGNVQRAVESGLTKNDAIQALTSDAAEILGVADQLGTIEVGKIANLIVTNGDLLARSTRVRYVFVDGSEFEVKRTETPRAGGQGGRPGGQPAAGTAADPVGEWALIVRTPQGEIESKLSLRREGDQITGTLSGPSGVFPLRNVVVAGNELRFGVSIQMGGDTMDSTVVGTIEGDTMRGVINLQALGSFEFTGTRPR